MLIAFGPLYSGGKVIPSKSGAPLSLHFKSNVSMPETVIGVLVLQRIFFPSSCPLYFQFSAMLVNVHVDGCLLGDEILLTMKWIFRHLQLPVPVY